MNLREWARATHKAMVIHPAEQRCKDFSVADVEQVLRTSILILNQTLVLGGELGIDNLGHLWVEEKPPRHVRNNLTKQASTYTLGARRIVRFRSSKRLVGLLNQRPVTNSGELEEI